MVCDKCKVKSECEYFKKLLAPTIKSIKKIRKEDFNFGQALLDTFEAFYCEEYDKNNPKKKEKEYKTIPNCNNCVNINITEKEQKLDFENSLEKTSHYCNLYHRRLFHKVSKDNKTVYEEYIIPCDKCINACCTNFTRADRNETKWIIE